MKWTKLLVHIANKVDKIEKTHAILERNPKYKKELKDLDYDVIISSASNFKGLKKYHQAVKQMEKYRKEILQTAEKAALSEDERNFFQKYCEERLLASLKVIKRYLIFVAFYPKQYTFEKNTFEFIKSEINYHFDGIKKKVSKCVENLGRTKEIFIELEKKIQEFQFPTYQSLELFIDELCLKEEAEGTERCPSELDTFRSPITQLNTARSSIPQLDTARSSISRLNTARSPIPRLNTARSSISSTLGIIAGQKISVSKIKKKRRKL